MPLNQVTAMVSGQLRRHITGYHMSKLTGSALRILTELALAIDDRGIPIDYRRRRDLAADAILIDDAAWARMTREAGMRLAPAANGRRYLYELLTGCALATAPPPYRLSAGSLTSYNDFVLGIPASLAPRWPATPAACSPAGESATSPCTGSHPTTGSPSPRGPAQTLHAPTPPPSTAPCWARTLLPPRSRRSWASPWATCARCCAGIRCPGPADRFAAPSSPHLSQPPGPPASSQA
jgi:hypothetical protein